MPKTSKPPKYRHFKRTDQAVVTIHGTDHYLGQYDSPESHELYYRLLADLWCKPDDGPKPTMPEPDDEITVTDLAIAYAKFVRMASSIRQSLTRARRVANR